jgi:hypothetical protein
MALPLMLQSGVKNALGRRIEPNKVNRRASILMPGPQSSVYYLKPSNRKMQGQAMTPEARPGSGL